MLASVAKKACGVPIHEGIQQLTGRDLSNLLQVDLLHLWEVGLETSGSVFQPELFCDPVVC